MFTAQSLHKILTDLPFKLANQCWVAYSGGLDSHVLLHALCQLYSDNLPRGLMIKAIHVNHGLSPFADAWSEHCVAVCKALGVTCIVKHVDVRGALEGNSLEEVARNLRYQTFKECMQPGDCLMLAHHQDDLAETFLLQALRGAGPKGLAAMAVVKPSAAASFERGLLLRPLLTVSRASLQAYAQREGLVWLEDESNADLKFDRNYLRNRIFPLLLERFPSANTALSRAAKHCAEADGLLGELAQEDLQRCPGTVEGTLSVQAVLNLSAARQKNLLRYWIQRHGFLLPTTVKLEALCQTVLLAREDASPCLTWSGVQVRRYRDDLYIMSPLPVHDATRVFDWAMSEALELPGIGRWTPIILPPLQKGGGAKRRGDFSETTYTVRFRQGGERMRLAGRSGAHSLKKLFQEWGVPPWLRDRIPLVFQGEELVMVVGYAMS